MAITYELIRDPLSPANTADTLKKVDDNGNVSFVPICEGNTDYEEYLEWAQVFACNKNAPERYSKLSYWRLELSVGLYTTRSFSEFKGVVLGKLHIALSQ